MCRRNDDDKKTYNDEDVTTVLLKMAETNSRSPRIHDIWNPALIAALDERATA